MKKFLTFTLSNVLVLTMVLGLASCGGSADTTAADTTAAGNPDDTAPEGDFAKIQANGYFTCGVTVYEYDGKAWKLITWNYTGEL